MQRKSKPWKNRERQVRIRTACYCVSAHCERLSHKKLAITPSSTAEKPQQQGPPCASYLFACAPLHTSCDNWSPDRVFRTAGPVPDASFNIITTTRCNNAAQWPNLKHRWLRWDIPWRRRILIVSHCSCFFPPFFFFSCYSAYVFCSSCLGNTLFEYALIKKKTPS